MIRRRIQKESLDDKNDLQLEDFVAMLRKMKNGTVQDTRDEMLSTIILGRASSSSFSILLRIYFLFIHTLLIYRQEVHTSRGYEWTVNNYLWRIINASPNDSRTENFVTKLGIVTRVFFL